MPEIIIDKTTEKKVYAIVDEFTENIPLPNDRYRLAYCLCKFVMGSGDSPEISVKTNKLNLKNISEEELGIKLNERFASFNKEV